MYNQAKKKKKKREREKNILVFFILLVSGGCMKFLFLRKDFKKFANFFSRLLDFSLLREWTWYNFDVKVVIKLHNFIKTQFESLINLILISLTDPRFIWGLGDVILILPTFFNQFYNQNIRKFKAIPMALLKSVFYANIGIFPVRQ